MNFERGQDPKKSMKIGKYANPTKVRCLKNQFSNEYHKLRFVKNHIYPYSKEGFADLVCDIYGRKILFGEIMFKEYFEIYS